MVTLEGYNLWKTKCMCEIQNRSTSDSKISCALVTDQGIAMVATKRGKNKKMLSSCIFHCSRKLRTFPIQWSQRLCWCLVQKHNMIFYYLNISLLYFKPTGHEKSWGLEIILFSSRGLSKEFFVSRIVWGETLSRSMSKSIDFYFINSSTYAQNNVLLNSFVMIQG